MRIRRVLLAAASMCLCVPLAAVSCGTTERPPLPASSTTPDGGGDGTFDTGASVDDAGHEGRAPRDAAGGGRLEPRLRARRGRKWRRVSRCRCPVCSGLPCRRDVRRLEGLYRRDPYMWCAVYQRHGMHARQQQPGLYPELPTDTLLHWKVRHRGSRRMRRWRQLRRLHRGKSSSATRAFPHRATTEAANRPSARQMPT